MSKSSDDKSARDLNLLFGVLAVQLHFIQPADLAKAAAVWATSPEKELGVVLTEMGLIGEENQKLVAQLLEAQVKSHRGDAAATLAEFGGDKAVEESFNPEGFSSKAAAPRPGAGEGTAYEATVHYTIKNEHARGAIGRVLIAFDQELEREVALKELLPESPSPFVSTDQSPMHVTAKAAARFLREAKITGQLEHPGIVPVYELAKRADGSIYYAMKLVRGQTLAEKMKETGDGIAARLPLINNFLDLCQAVAYAHSRGVIHRDLKPANIMIGEFGETVVLDWGWAKKKGLQDERAAELMESVRQIKDVGIEETIKGQPVGTPAYMSPEQARGDVELIDERSDVWSLGAILYQLLTGRIPFPGESAYEVMGKVIKEPLTPARKIEPKAPPELCAIAEKCLEKEQSKRYQNAGELAEDLAKFQSGGLVSAYDYSATLLARHWLKHKWKKVSLYTVIILFIMAMFDPTLMLIYFNFFIDKNAGFTDEELSSLLVSVEEKKLFSLIERPSEPGNAASKIMQATHHALIGGDKAGAGTFYLDAPLNYPWFEQVKESLLWGNTGDPSILEKGLDIPELDTFLSAGRLKDFQLIGVEFFPRYGVTIKGQIVPNYIYMQRFAILGIAKARKLEKEGKVKEAEEVLANLLRIGHHLEKDYLSIGQVFGVLIKDLAAHEMDLLLTRNGETERAAAFNEYYKYQQKRHRGEKLDQVKLYEKLALNFSEERLKELLDNQDILPAVRSEILVQLANRSLICGYRRFFWGPTAKDKEYLYKDHFKDTVGKLWQWIIVSDSQRGFFYRYYVVSNGAGEFVFGHTLWDYD